MKIGSGCGLEPVDFNSLLIIWKKLKKHASGFLVQASYTEAFEALKMFWKMYSTSHLWHRYCF